MNHTYISISLLIIEIDIRYNLYIHKLLWMMSRKRLKFKSKDSLLWSCLGFFRSLQLERLIGVLMITLNFIKSVPSPSSSLLVLVLLSSSSLLLLLPVLSFFLHPSMLRERFMKGLVYIRGDQARFLRKFNLHHAVRRRRQTRSE